MFRASQMRLPHDRKMAKTSPLLANIAYFWIDTASLTNQSLDSFNAPTSYVQIIKILNVWIFLASW